MLNLLANKKEKLYDDKGSIARTGLVNTALLSQLNNLDYYLKFFPKSLANDFGTNVIFPLIESFNLSTADALRTYTEHIVQQIVYAINLVNGECLRAGQAESMVNKKLLATGGGTFNNFLIERLSDSLKVFDIEVVVPDENLIKYKEALIMGLLGVLRWREEDTVMSSVTGASRNSIGGAVWMGQES